MGIFKNKDSDWFNLFVTSISYSSKAAQALQKAFEDGSIDYNELQNLKSIEQEADTHVHRSLKLVEEAFVTPIDRSDIIEIINEIENITDCIETISNYTYMTGVKRVNEATQNLMQLLVDACLKLEDLMKNLKNYKKNLKIINDYIIEINRIEEMGDKTYINAMRNLFEHETDAKKIIITQLLYEKLEEALDKCEDVADAVQKVIISGIG
ncbi:MAG: DUF47 family protein [Clostridiaceae bacterium]|nr:DUF47 family protein [Clostridiaceae bacterium]